MKLQRVCIVIVGLFLLVPLAHAQPELKVGQEAIIWQDWGSGILVCGGKITEITDQHIVVNPKESEKGYWYKLQAKKEGRMRGIVEGCVSTLSSLRGYLILDPKSGRILKPAPRPEFKLLIYAGSCSPENQNSIECAVYANQGAIADELRYLHKKIEALKK